MSDMDQKILLHWLSLSMAQRHGLAALAKEVETASQLLETSVESLSERFMELACIAERQKQEMDALRKKASCETQDDDTHPNDLSKSIADIVMRMQFQDRTAQRLTYISATLNAMSGMLEEMEKGSMPLLENLQQIEPNQQWLEDMIQGLQLSEMKERFVKHALFDNGNNVFDDKASGGDLKVEHAESSDDIELF